MRTSHPAAQGLYDPAFEHDACGVAFVAKLDGVPTHRLVDDALTALANLDHRGATGADEAAGDGAGILTQIPDQFFRSVVDFPLPEAGQYAVGIAFLPVDEEQRELAMIDIEKIALEERLRVNGWRELPVVTEELSPISLEAMPHMAQIFVSDRKHASGLGLDRLVYALRRRARNETGTYFASLSARTIVYKGMLTTTQLAHIYPDLSDERYTSALALVHSRFSTNTFPSWPLAHPYRLIAHNGEINTVKGNRNWMRAREALLHSDLIPGDLERLFPICDPEGSDSASFDEVLELLHLGGRSLPHAVMMMVPEAWAHNDQLPPAHRAFFDYHACLMEPWDGPAAICFTDGTLIGATLDRNGLRPARYWVTDEMVVLASEAGVLDIDQSRITEKGRLRPGRMLLVDLAQHRLIDDREIKDELAAEHPYAQWLDEGRVFLDDLPERTHIVHGSSSVARRQAVFGFSHEDLAMTVAPMANTGADPIGSMGSDTPLPVLSDKARSLFDYFSHLFAQVTNPPLDAIREELVTSLETRSGPQANLLAPGPESARQLVLASPVINSEQLAKIVHLGERADRPGPELTRVISCLYPVAGGAEALRTRLAEMRDEASAAIEAGALYIVLSDRHSNDDLAPIPSLLSTANMHHHLVNLKQRARIGMMVEAGDVREVHHMALLMGYGAAAVNPYLLFESAEDLARRESLVRVSPEQAIANVVSALEHGLLKVMSKMGVSTMASYQGAEIFEAVGLNSQFMAEFFPGTASRIEGIGLEQIAADIAAHHRRAYPTTNALPHRTLQVGGQFKWRREGEQHLWDPESVFRLQHATSTGNYETFKQYTARIDDNSSRLMTLRALLDLKPAGDPVDIDEVEPVSEIVKRFSTGAMSYGSISQEAHETLAIAMNRLGARSNTGEGGEDPERLHDPERCSAIKQVASGRFGVTSEYLSYATDLQIKMAQGAKPGEGGQLPGPKVYPWIARTRHATTGVGLISPPPHHDIYSIEDLKQLIHDLKCANPAARVHVKLVSQIGVGTVAAGVAKAKADVVLISGHDGGTGAAPLTSIKHAGGPWELGLAETQQTLLLNGLRDRVVVQCDGQLKTGRDVIIAALLGAEEFGFATTALVTTGCVMMRACHKDTCPVGVATQNPELRKKFTGKPEYVINFMQFIAQEVREYLAELGLRSIDEAVGRSDLLDIRRAVTHHKAAGLDLSPILHQVEAFPGQDLRCTKTQDHELDDSLDVQLIELARPALADGTPVSASLPIRNVDRTVGTMLGHQVTMATAGAGLPSDTIRVEFTGTAGQSFGAFLPAGISFVLHGDANDYLAKGLSGGRIAVRVPEEARFEAAGQVIAGNTVAYGATSGELLVNGRVGERFCVRNSGATAVVEGVGDHGLEYMTGGEVLILGPTGRNLAAGMSGGIAWVLDLDEQRLNTEQVDPVVVTASDVRRIRELLNRHLEVTGSARAAELVALTDQELSTRFTTLEPRDYARIVAARDDAIAKGLDQTRITEIMMEAARG